MKPFLTLALVVTALLVGASGAAASERHCAGKIREAEGYVSLSTSWVRTNGRCTRARRAVRLFFREALRRYTTCAIAATERGCHAGSFVCRAGEYDPDRPRTIYHECRSGHVYVWFYRSG